ncbi:ATP-binding cassette domain-containing protein [Celerinatantimonas diazotrophica]|uniref:ABC-type multidrug transport system fused ATPase/permease subunit n=1 Tax=Celerinatantimonas diazotrophica TaxID=412034 RepID=A0A4R1JLI4_9GAMM|nr:ABC transporter ATP-binding protein [Celerinatantimonas diazotrophica]TCK51915.1 ABC-type multidrug transport system fused ATPase/permease subunit [Celerinatantimonas diazotrophica]CAG9296388.1 Lipid A export ATP-binding/permease protein MsbA [Celerinatantimonas diazotrophica]
MNKEPHQAQLFDPLLRPAIKPVLPQLGLGILAEGIAGLATLAALWCLIQLITDLSIIWVLYACVCWGIGAICSSSASWISHQAEANFSSRLRRQVAIHLTQLPTRTLTRYDDNALRRLVSEDIAALHHMVAHLPAEIATFIIVPFASVIMLLMMSGPVALLALLPGCIAAMYYLIIVPRHSVRFNAERVAAMETIVTAINNYVRGIRINRLFNAQSGALANYHDATNRFTQGMVMWVSHVATTAAIATALLQAVATFAIAYWVSYELSPVALAATMLFGLAIVTPSLRLGHGLDYLSSGRAAGQRIAELLREATLPKGNASLQVDDAKLTAQELSIHTENGALVEHFSHPFSPGKLTVIMGPSGSGKTTLLQILAGLEQSDSGEVCLGNQNIMALNEQVRHQTIQLLPQTNPVLNATIRENLLLSAPDASDQQLHEALTHAQLEIDLDADASILSGGEQQRVALARLFLSPATILLLDEPTSALDHANAQQLMAALLHLTHSQNKTLIMVTHDPALTAQADQHIDLKKLPQRNASSQHKE